MTSVAEDSGLMNRVQQLPSTVDFPLLQNVDGNKSFHYLDNAATTQMPGDVIQAVTDCYRHYNAPIHRGLYPLAEQASQRYEAARSTVAQFINASSNEQIVFTHSATESINMVAQGWLRPRLKPGDQVWVTRMEHHANFLPWQRLCRESGASLRIIELSEQGELNWQTTEGLFDKSTALIALTQVSNVLGIENPTHKICQQAAANNIPVLVDAAQAVGHQAVDVTGMQCDFLVFSAHKMYGPAGIGILYGKTERLAEMEPLLLGGGMVDYVGKSESQWADIPARFEAGSPNLAGAIGLAAAINFLQQFGMDRVHQYVSELTQRAYKQLSDIGGVTLYPAANSRCSNILSFNLADIHPHDVAQITGEQGVALRAGHHCCQPLMQYLGVDSTLRVSFALYNHVGDIKALLDALDQAKSIFK